MIDVPHRPYVQVRLVPLKLLLRHDSSPYKQVQKQFLDSAMRAPNGIRTHDLALTKGALYQLSYEGLPLYKFCFAAVVLVQRPVDGEGFEPPKGFAQLIYSQSPLATWVTVQARAVASSQVRLLIWPQPTSLAGLQLSRRRESNP